MQDDPKAVLTRRIQNTRDLPPDESAASCIAALTRAGFEIVEAEPLCQHIKALTRLAGRELAKLPPAPKGALELVDEPIWLEPNLLAPDMKRPK